MKRDVVRLVTPGTLTEDALLEAKRNNLLLAVARGRPASDAEPAYGLAWLDISTGEFRVAETDGVRLAADIARLEPGEILVAETLHDDPGLRAFWRALPAVTPLDRGVFDGATAERRLSSFFGVATIDVVRRAFAYRARRRRRRDHLYRAHANRAEAQPLAAEPRGGGLGSLDRRRDAGQSRTRPHARGRTRRELALDHRPHADLRRRAAIWRAGSRARSSIREAINARLDAVAFLAADGALRDQLRRLLSEVSDLSRALSRLALSRGGPRDLAAVRDSLALAAKLAEIFARTKPPAELSEAAAAFASVKSALAAELENALAAELPLSKAAGGFVHAGYDKDLDEAHELRDESRRVIASLQTRYAEETGIRALKIKHNNVLGYFVEVAGPQGEKLMTPPLRETFIHRQTLAGVMRFSSTELGELESRIASAANRTLALELAIFDRLSAEILAQARALEVARRRDRPHRRGGGARRTCGERKLDRVPSSRIRLPSRIEGGRHPVVEAALRRDGGPFVANDCDLSAAGKNERRQDLARHRPQHGGEIHVPPPERADRDSGADGLVRAGEGGGNRRDRPPVLARRRRRRSRARPLDLHGRDGGDRGDPQSGEPSARS